jgi:rare lipoprotein A
MTPYFRGGFLKYSIKRGVAPLREKRRARLWAEGMRNMLFLCFGVMFFLTVVEQKTARADVPAPEMGIYREQGCASWYGSGTPTGKKTASGRGFDRNEFTAAHPSLPFGTVVRVFNLHNNRQTLVILTDRGPYSKKRIIDLSCRAADALKMRRSGVVPVVIEVVGDGAGRPLNSYNSFYLLMERTESARKAHSMSAQLQAALGREIRGLIMATPSGKKAFSLCIGPFPSFTEAEKALVAIEPKRQVLEIIEAPTDGGDVPLHVPPLIRSAHTKALAEKKEKQQKTGVR